MWLPKYPPISDPMNGRAPQRSDRTAPEEQRSDPVNETRRRLIELLSASGRSIDPADPDMGGTWPGALEPQRARSTRSTSRRSRSKTTPSGDSDRLGSRWEADPVAAGSEWGQAEPKQAGARRSSSEPPLPGGTVEQAKDACLRLLAVCARSRAELAQRLAAKGFTPEVTENALDRLAEVDLINDAAFAEEWVHARHTFSGKGKQALAQELRRKGVAQSDAAPALDAITADDEELRATELVRRKLRSTPANLDRDKTIRRLVGMLARRGYNQSTAYQVVKAELANHGATSEDLPDSIE
jgi:regulatory protein